MANRYRIFDWYLEDATNYKKVVHNEVVCGSLFINKDTQNNENIYFYNEKDVYSNEVGNTFSTILALGPDSQASMSIEDGKYNFQIKVATTGITIEGTTIEYDFSNFVDILATLINDEARVYLDNKLVWSGKPSKNSLEFRNKLGFGDPLPESSTIYIKYLRCTSGARYPIDLDSLKFEVQVDTVDTFDSVNLRTYTNEGTVVSCKEDTEIKSVASGNKLARSFRIPTPPRQPNMPYFYFYRVRVLGDNDKVSDWAYYMFDKPENPYMYATKEILENLNGAIDHIVVLCLENDSSYMFLKGSDLEPDGEEVLSCSISDGVWKKVNNSYFILDPDISDAVFEHMYNARMPGENVYTHYNKSGNIANVLSTEAKLVDKVEYELVQAIRNENIHSAQESVLDDNFGKKYNLTKDYFDNNLEYRNSLLEIQKCYCYPGEYNKLKRVIKAITGVNPDIEEYKNMTGWIIWNEADAISAPESEKFVLKDEETIYPERNEAVLYSEEELAFGFDIHIYNPFDLKLPEDLIKSVVYSFKPAVSMANIIMHDKYGREYQYPAHYYFSNYGNGLYYPNDYEGINV